MKLPLAIIIASLTVTGCSSLGDVVTGTHTTTGYRHYDPCIRCGESWQRVPNREFNALYEAEKQGAYSKASYRANLEQMYGPDWATKYPRLGERYAE